MKQKENTAIILGATGLSGGLLLKLLLADENYSKVKLFSRSSVGFKHPKLEEYLVDLFNSNEYKTDFIGDEVFCCIGTTKSKTPDKETYKKIDFGIPVATAKLAKENGINTYMVISALGADAKSSVFYNRVKGKMQDEVLKLKIQNTYILQPSLIGGSRSEKRTGEWLFKQVMKVFGVLLIGSLKKYKTIEPETIAKALVWLANNEYDNVVIESDQIKKLVE
ncbi:NAD(P)H-binding protein [Cellulophaga baltica]|uniref:NAD(P)H-binding protein n=1 Tax=Cellulophaga TaxID=104264 RepID=UPI001C071FC3|nr:MULTISPECIES: NAD(P)H-binding protein [Cellulophaga]MBU2995756.1 NAD(P)H-binding protein [Cellulophaga baltica]MDO6767150.1 NAD(P)H-binding protein [Cellulophaga sp. 1_MG-2023]